MPPTMPTSAIETAIGMPISIIPIIATNAMPNSPTLICVSLACAPWRCARSSSSSFSSSLALFGWKSWFSVSMRFVNSSSVARTRVAGGDQREDHQPGVPHALRPDQRRRPGRLRGAAVLQRVADDLEREPGDEGAEGRQRDDRQPVQRRLHAARELLVEDVDADVAAPHQRQAEGDRRADRQRIAAEFVGALQRDVEDLAADRLDRHHHRQARKMPPKTVASSVSMRSFMLIALAAAGRVERPGRRAPSGRPSLAWRRGSLQPQHRCRPSRSTSPSSRGWTCRTPRPRPGSDTLLTALRISSTSAGETGTLTSLNFLPVVHGSLPALQFSASWNSSSEYFQISSVSAVEGGLQLGLLVGLEAGSRPSS